MKLLTRWADSFPEASKETEAPEAIPQILAETQIQVQDHAPIFGYMVRFSVGFSAGTVLGTQN